MRSNQRYWRLNNNNRRGETLGIRITEEIGIGHMKGRIEIEGTVKVLVTVDQGQVQG